MLLKNPFYKPQLLVWIEKMFNHAKNQNWFYVYFAIDLHGVISKPDYRKTSKVIDYYPYAKETLQLLSKRDDIILILFTSSYPDEVKIYMETFINDGINFKYINENPEIDSSKGNFGFYDKKFYFNVLMDDKAGFLPTDWYYIFKYFKRTKYRPDSKWSIKY